MPGSSAAGGWGTAVTRPPPPPPAPLTLHRLCASQELWVSRTDTIIHLKMRNYTGVHAAQGHSSPFLHLLFLL